MLPTRCRSRIRLTSETCSLHVVTWYTTCEYLHFDRGFGWLLCAKLLKITESFEEVALFEQTVPFSLFILFFGLILLFYIIINIAILVCSGQRYFLVRVPIKAYIVEAVVLALIIDQASA